MNTALVAVDPSLAAPLATIASALATAILLYATYHWPSGRNEHDDEERIHRHRHTKPEDDEEQDQEGNDV